MTEWLKNAVFYEIYPQSFKDSNGDGIGDFNGIVSKLDYIRDLGCNAIWINPCFESPFMDAGYDVSDYKKAAPRYGTNEELFRLFDEAHKRGMHVLLDLVPGHTSIKHEWFGKSALPEKNEYSDRYIWTNTIWENVDGLDNIKGFSDRDGCCGVNFFSHQPALNYGYAHPERDWQASPEDEAPMATREAVKDVMRFWLSHGCDGFRVDMAGSLVKKDPDGSANIKLWQDFRAFLDKEYPDAAIISEWGEPDKSLLGGFHMDFLLHFGPSHYNDLFRCEEPYFSRRGKGSAEAFVEKYKENYGKTNGRGLICIPSGNHDMERMRKYLDPEEMKLAFAFLLSMPGAPFIYYGDEIGMRYIEGLTSKEGGYNRTGSRTPMQWDSSANAGFSDGPAEKLYLPVDGSADRPEAARELADDDSLVNEIKRLIELRQAHSALMSEGRIEFVSSGYPLMYRRFSDDEEILVIINPAEENRTVDIDVNGSVIYSVGKAPEISQGTITVYGTSASFIKIR